MIYSNRPEDLATLTISNMRLNTYLETYPMIGIDTENQGKIVAISALRKTGGVSFLYQQSQGGLQSRTKDLIKTRKPIRVNDRKEDWKLIAWKTGPSVTLHSGSWMLRGLD